MTPLLPLAARVGLGVRSASVGRAVTQNRKWRSPLADHCSVKLFSHSFRGRCLPNRNRSDMFRGLQDRSLGQDLLRTPAASPQPPHWSAHKQSGATEQNSPPQAHNTFPALATRKRFRKDSALYLSTTTPAHASTAIATRRSTFLLTSTVSPAPPLTRAEYNTIYLYYRSNQSMNLD